MAEKRRGLGRGLGSLIPSQEPGRPSDVFFPRGERSADVTTPEEPAKERRSSDPAESMRRAQAGRRTAAAKRPGTRSAAPAKSSEVADAPAATVSATTTRKTTSTGSSGAKKSTSATKRSQAGKNSSSATKASTRKKSETNSSAAAQGKTGAARKTAEPKTTRGATSAQGSASQVGTDSAPVAETAAGSTIPAAASGVSNDAVESNLDQTPDIDSTRDSSSVSESVTQAEGLISNTRTDDGAAEDAGGGVYVSRERVLTHPSAVTDSQLAEDSRGESAEALSGPAEDGSRDVIDGDADVSHETADHLDDDQADEGLVPVPGTTFGEIDLELIRPNPRQPRDVFDEDALDELITSIREIGVLQPVVVRRRPEMPGHYELIMGERRFRASKEAGKKTIPAIVRATADDDLLRDALLENLHRVDLNPLEEAAAYAQLLEDFNCTQEELSTRIGRSRPQISNTIRLLRLPAMVQRRVAAGVLSSGHARALLGLNDGANMEVLAQRVVAEGLSVRATEEAVVLLNRGERVTVSRGTREPDPELAALARNLGDRLDTRVNVVMGKRKGKLSVEFANGEDLGRILSLLGLDVASEDD